MMILQKQLQRGDGHAGKRWYWFAPAEAPVRHTEAWDHETFAEEQARWERTDPEYAWICKQVREAKGRGGEASLRAHEAKAEWDARVATQRQTNDDAQRMHHADQTARRRPATSRTSSEQPRNRSLKSTRTPRLVIRTREGHHRLHATFAIESNDSPAPGIMPEPVRVGKPDAKTAPRGKGLAARRRFRGPSTPNSVDNEPTQLEVQ